MYIGAFTHPPSDITSSSVHFNHPADSFNNDKFDNVKKFSYHFSQNHFFVFLKQFHHNRSFLSAYGFPCGLTTITAQQLLLEIHRD